jgi:hypothetical protein
MAMICIGNAVPGVWIDAKPARLRMKLTPL